MAISLPEPELVARFRRDVADVAPDVAELGLAVSGGPDSLALLLLAQAAFPGRIAAATVDHGLRTASGEEARFVAALCADLGVSHTILEAQVDVGAASLQQSARRSRYDALAAWLRECDIATLATAHHADDQAETVLMRLLRGSGTAGLAGVRAHSPLPGTVDLSVVRPLLGWRRAELRAVVEATDVTPVDDPSNHDERFDRTVMRVRMAMEDWIDPAALARSAAALAEAEQALVWTTDRLYRDRVRSNGALLVFEYEDVPREFIRRILLLLLASLAPGAAPRGQEVDRLIATLQEGGTATLAGVKCTGGALWRFERAPPRRPTI